MNEITDALGYIINQFMSVGIFDILDIMIVSVLFYYVYKFVRERRAGKLAVGILFILLVMVLSSFFRMNALDFIISNIVQVGIIGIIILFQNELRSFLEKVGGEPLRGITSRRDSEGNARITQCIKTVVDAVFELSAEKTGALIVFERGTKLGDCIKSGTVVNADPSVYLIRNIFFDKSPLHDGAVVIRDGRIHAAACFLPLSTGDNIIKTLGTRHRAAIGMSENSDAAVIVVSEETGTVSVALEGHLTRGLSQKDLILKLESLLLGDGKDSDEGNVHKTIGKLLPMYRKDKSGEENENTVKKNGKKRKSGSSKTTSDGK